MPGQARHDERAMFLKKVYPLQYSAPRLVYHAAADDVIPVVEDYRLARRYRALRLVELYSYFILGELLDGRGLLRRAVAYLCAYPRRAVEFLNCYEVRARGGERLGI